MDSKRAVKEYREIAKFSKKTNMRLAAEGWNKPWKILIATIMSAQTRDEVTIEVATKLFREFGTPKKLGEAKLDDIEKILKRINYFRTKSKNIIGACMMIAEDGLGESLEDLIKLPGVGRKTANVFLTEIGLKKAIPVDTHVFRISHKMGWAKGNIPDKVEKELEELFPKSYWSKLNPTLVRFGKEYGRSKRQEDEILKSIKKM
jgi:endonuclease III